jgi:hypothetical protein
VALGYTWKQLGQNITGEADGDNFGGSVSLSEDGKTLAIGAKVNDNDGIVEDSSCVKINHLDDDGTSWEQLGQDIDGETATDRLDIPYLCRRMVQLLQLEHHSIVNLVIIWVM